MRNFDDANVDKVRSLGIALHFFVLILFGWRGIHILPAAVSGMFEMLCLLYRSAALCGTQLAVVANKPF